MVIGNDQGKVLLVEGSVEENQTNDRNLSRKFRKWDRGYKLNM